MSAAQKKTATRSIEKEIEINAPIETVWKALTDAKELTQWFPLEAGENPDGTMWMSWRNEFKFASRIEIWEPPRHVRTVPVQSNWSQEKKQEDDAASSGGSSWGLATDFYLESRGGATALRLVHSGFSLDADWDALYDGTYTGWNFQLWALRHYLENHHGIPRRTAYVREFLKDVSREEAWQILCGPNGLIGAGQLHALQPEDHYAIRTAAGDDLAGVIHSLQPPYDFSATVENLN
ncbi:MAG: SRPBCC domain-containing protein, partial [bacterium]